MRKVKFIFLFLYLIMGTCGLQAQNFKKDGSNYIFYCNIVCTENSDGSLETKILFDEIKEGKKLRDYNGSPLKFNTNLQVMNFMAKRGWQYVEQEKTDSKTIILFKKSIKNEKEALEGLYFDISSLNKGNGNKTDY